MQDLPITAAELNEWKTNRVTEAFYKLLDFEYEVAGNAILTRAEASPLDTHSIAVLSGRRSLITDVKNLRLEEVQTEESVSEAQDESVVAEG